MATHYHRAMGYLRELLSGHSAEELQRRLEPKLGQPAQRMPAGTHITPEITARRWGLLRCGPDARESLLDAQTARQLACFERHIENFIGTVKVPVGIAGPLRVNGLFAQGEFFVPMATTEAALVASYHRGAQLMTEAGGCTAMLLNEGIRRAPGLAFRDLKEAGLFTMWALEQLPMFRLAAESTTKHGKLVDMSISVEGNHVYLVFDFTCGDAAGQNMVTIATQAICEWIQRQSPVKPTSLFLEANASGDKKASAQSFMSVRGRKVSAEARVPAALVEKRLHTSPRRMAEYWQISAVGGVLSGTMGVQGHLANGLAAMYLACGQDVACVAESAVGLTRMQVQEDGALYAAVTLPNLVVGTVGGGTGLPSQRACLEILGLVGEGKAQCAGGSVRGHCARGRAVDRGSDVRWRFRPCASASGARTQITRRKTGVMMLPTRAQLDDQDGIRYAQCWEDADVLLDALDVREGDVCLAIASAGDNALAMLCRNPARVVAIDRNPAQLACLELRVAAYRRLEHGELLELIGSRPSERRVELYRRCASDLSAWSRRFWDAHTEGIEAGIGSAGQFERYFALFRRHILPLMHSDERVRELLSCVDVHNRREFYRDRWDTWRWRLLFHLFFSRAVMGRLGRDRSCFQHVRGSVAEPILSRSRRALTELDPRDNPYLQWILTGRHESALPYALRPENFEIIRSRLDRLEWHCCSIKDQLRKAGPRSIDRFNLSDIFEYMPEDVYHRLLESLAEAGRPGGRLVYWNMLVPRCRPEAMADRLLPRDELARELHLCDKAFFYQRLVIEEVLG